MNEYLFLYSQSGAGESAVIVEAETLTDAREIWRQNVLFAPPSTPLPYFRAFAVNRVSSVGRALAANEKQV